MKNTETKYIATILTLKIFSSSIAMIGKAAKNYQAKVDLSKIAKITSHKAIVSINLKSDL